ncbi:family 16 glycosylhydrolase [Marinilabilia rubra]|uniref:GH16 domain-containing protein n=1 Tax=Marinilabilia rubra TaxID=2162893 RepID=A0A2U2B8G0_9BACT|nr:family 16 glycosylhydrolase [Marinilabilia rubra]PWD99347.1 hypothetical protein DDZ16_10065 [Marinilabilia rubra]
MKKIVLISFLIQTFVFSYGATVITGDDCLQDCGTKVTFKELKPVSDIDGDWVLDPNYSDEFNTTVLDSDKWDDNITSWGLWTWRPENIVANGSSLTIRMDYEHHSRVGFNGDLLEDLYYYSGAIRSKAPSVKYGYFEAKIKGSEKYPGVCPAFWLYHKEGGLANKNPTYWTEIDIVELTQNVNYGENAIGLNIHAFNHPNLVDEIHEGYEWHAPWNPDDEYHVYGVEWDENSIKWFVDGVLRLERENDYWDQPLDVVLSFGLRKPLKDVPSPEGFPASFDIDYVRVWSKVVK